MQWIASYLLCDCTIFNKVKMEMKDTLATIFAIFNIIQFAAGKRCQDLRVGQFKCNDPEIDTKLQTEKGCRKNHTVTVACFPAPGVVCDGTVFDGNSVGFYKEVPCRYVTGKSFEAALFLSVFLGCFGIDRFYLGYPAIGLLKFCTLGFFMIFQLIDVILIATQVLKPADGSEYVIAYYGPKVYQTLSNNDTLFYPQNFQ